MKKIHRSEFLKQAKTLFPEIRSELNRENGLLFLEVDCFRRFVQQMIDGGDKERLLKAFLFAEKMLKLGNKNLSTAFVVTFVEHLNFNDDSVKRKWALELLPERLAASYADWQSILGGRDNR